MSRNKRIAIILPDTLQSLGLSSILSAYFSPIEVCCFTAYEPFSASTEETFDYFFTEAETFLLYADFFLPRKNKTMLFIQRTQPNILSVGVWCISTSTSQEQFIEQLSLFFGTEHAGVGSTEGNKELSSRETDVLQLVVKGNTNKDVADKLNISLNTVLSHRKNITSKLGIKTVSGLTFYAIMNGLIAGDDIEL